MRALTTQKSNITLSVFVVIASLFAMSSAVRPARAQEPPPPPTNNQSNYTHQLATPKPSSKPVPKPPVQTTANRIGLTVHGSFFERYRNDIGSRNHGTDSQGAVTYGYVLGNYGFTHAWSAYLRLGGEGITQGEQLAGRDMNTNYYNSTHGFSGALAFDQYGFIYAPPNTGLTVTIGKQDKSLDDTSTLYDLSWKVGRYTFLDGISADQIIGHGTIELDAFSEDQYYQVDNRGTPARNALYAFHGTYTVSRPVTFGLIVGRF